MSTHWIFILSAYGLAFVAILGSILAIMIDHSQLKKALTRMEARAAATGATTGSQD